MTRLEEHPGYLGLTSRGVIAIHADWPVYAVEHGWRFALRNLGQFPRGTVFRVISDIDQCFLFFVGELSQAKDPFDEQHFHVAVWHEDILELLQLGYICGVSQITPREWASRRAKELEGMVLCNPNGTFTPVPRPDPEDYDDEGRVPVVLPEGITVTESGYTALQELMSDEKEHLHPDIQERVNELVALGKYDTAIREACLLLEIRLKQLTGTTLYGQRLLARFFSELFESGEYVSAQLKSFRAEVRTAFKFVRNEYMHNLRDVTEEQCYAILVRISSVYEALQTFG